MPKLTPLHIEYRKACARELKFLEKRNKKKDGGLTKMLADKVPAGLQSTLDKAFEKSFALIFEKGTGLIEKTYDKEKIRQDFQLDDYIATVKNDKKSLKTISAKADRSSLGNTLVSGVSGAGMGFVGIGLPDIAVFTALMLKNLYQLSAKYGYDYEKEEEKQFILMLIQGAFSYGEQLLEINDRINSFIHNKVFLNGINISENITKTAACLSSEMLYLKFLQGIPLVGAVGGGYDAVYMNRINSYANMKYNYRYLNGRLRR
jgi:hypothetical protein